MSARIIHFPKRAPSMAAEIVTEALLLRRRKHSIIFSVMNNYKPLPFAVHWQFKNTAGVTFAKTNTAEAETWITGALLAGYGICLHWGGRGGGGGVYFLDQRVRA
jgi:hypothetical protein